MKTRLGRGIRALFEKELTPTEKGILLQLLEEAQRAVRRNSAGSNQGEHYSLHVRFNIVEQVMLSTGELQRRFK